jgi:hypothetical protein
LQKLQDVHTGLALMSDDDHRVADERAGAMRRSATRLEARISELQKAHDDAIIAEAEAERLAALDQLRARAEAARKANEREAKKLLDLYAEHGTAIGDLPDKLKLIKAETEAVNAALSPLRSPRWSRAMRISTGPPPARKPSNNTQRCRAGSTAILALPPIRIR